MKQLIFTTIIAVFFTVKLNAQTKLPYTGTKEFYDEANASTYSVRITNNGDCIITFGMPEVKPTIIYKGKYKNKVVTKDGGFLFDDNYLYLLDDRGNKRSDCMKTKGDDFIECTCKYNLKTTKLE